MSPTWRKEVKGRDQEVHPALTWKMLDAEIDKGVGNAAETRDTGVPVSNN